MHTRQKGQEKEFAISQSIKVSQANILRETRKLRLGGVQCKETSSKAQTKPSWSLGDYYFSSWQSQNAVVFI